MEIKIQLEKQNIVCRMEGRLDTAASLEIVDEMQQLANLADKQIIMDCSKLTFVSSSGLRQFLSLRKESIAKGGTVILKAVNKEVKQVFALTGFLTLFEIED